MCMKLLKRKIIKVINNNNNNKYYKKKSVFVIQQLGLFRVQKEQGHTPV